MNQRFLISLIILACLTLSLSFFFLKDAWMEPDSTRFYNRACLDAGDFNTPILSKIVFELLPCNVIAWKIFQIILILSTISALYFFSKTMLKDKKLFLISFLSYYLLNFLLSIEDDQIALPIIIGLSTILLNKPNIKNKILYAIAIIFLSLLVWQGAYIPMLIILAWTIEPIFGIIIVIGGILYQIIQNGINVFFNPHIGNELMVGQGFIINDLILLLFFFSKDKKKKIKENKKIFLLFTAFNLLSFVIPKMAYFSILPNLLMANILFDENQKKWLILAGALALCISPAMFLYDSYPNQQTWKVIDQAVEIQKDKNKIFFNEWFLGSWFYYKGGMPTQEGGWQGDYTKNIPDYYWLGLEDKNCSIISRSGLITLQHCVKN